MILGIPRHKGQNVELYYSIWTGKVAAVVSLCHHIHLRGSMSMCMACRVMVSALAHACLAMSIRVVHQLFPAKYFVLWIVETRFIKGEQKETSVS